MIFLILFFFQNASAESMPWLEIIVAIWGGASTFLFYNYIRRNAIRELVTARIKSVDLVNLEVKESAFEVIALIQKLKTKQGIKAQRENLVVLQPKVIELAKKAHSGSSIIATLTHHLSLVISSIDVQYKIEKPNHNLVIANTCDDLYIIVTRFMEHVIHFASLVAPFPRWRPSTTISFLKGKTSVFYSENKIEIYNSDLGGLITKNNHALLHVMYEMFNTTNFHFVKRFFFSIRTNYPLSIELFRKKLYAPPLIFDEEIDFGVQLFLVGAKERNKNEYDLYYSNASPFFNFVDENEINLGGYKDKATGKLFTNLLQIDSTHYATDETYRIVVKKNSLVDAFKKHKSLIIRNLFPSKIRRYKVRLLSFAPTNWFT